MQNLQGAGLLANGPSEPLETVYDGQFSYVHAAGFRVAEEFVVTLSRPRAASSLGAFQGLGEQLCAAGSLGASQGIGEQLRPAGVTFDDTEDGEDTGNEVEDGP